MAEYVKSDPSSPECSMVRPDNVMVKMNSISGSVHDIHDAKHDISEESKQSMRRRSRSIDDSQNHQGSFQHEVVDKHQHYLIINYEKDHSAELPGGKLINLIKETYPEHLGPDNRLTIAGVIEIVRMGAKLNYLDCINADIMSELAHILDLPLSLENNYIDSISKLVSALSSDHRTRYSNANSKFNNRRQALVINPQARIMHYNDIQAVGHTESFQAQSGETGKQAKCLCLLSTKARYRTFYACFVLLSFVCFIIFALLAYVQPMYDLFGPSIMISRGAALAIIVFTMVTMFFVSYDLTTCIRKRLKGRCSTLFDFQILFHRFCGYMVMTYSIIHTVGHMTGTFRGIHEEDDLDEINKALTHYQLKERKRYHQLLFATVPGVTGLLLLFIIVAMGITAMQCTRRKHFKVFSVVHILGFPSFILLIIAHGSQSWLNYGFPVGSITVIFSLIIYLVYFIRRTLLQCKGKFRVINAEITSNKGFLKIVIERPRDYKYSLGQYAFINFPQISCWEWHPYSIASCSRSSRINFIIKNNGDWSEDIVNLFADYKEKGSLRRESNLESANINHEDSEVGGLVHDGIVYPKVNLSYPISSPVQQSAYHDNVVYIGTGVGITTFLGFIELQYMKAKNSATEGDTNICRIHNKDVIDVVFISREAENIMWIAKYINAALTLPQMTRKLKFHIYITLKDESKSLASFLFWRAMTLYNKKLVKNHRMYSDISICLGRPDFEQLFDKLFSKNKYNEHFVYCCGPLAITKTLEKLSMEKSKKEGMKINFNYEIF